MPLPQDYEQMSMADSVEMSLAGLDQHLTPADMTMVTAVRKAARAIDKLEEDGEVAKALSYHYLVTGGLEKLGGSVAARVKLELKPEQNKESKLAAVRGIRDNSNANRAAGKKEKQAGAGRKAG